MISTLYHNNTEACVQLQAKGGYFHQRVVLFNGCGLHMYHVYSATQKGGSTELHPPPPPPYGPDIAAMSLNCL